MSNLAIRLSAGLFVPALFAAAWAVSASQTSDQAREAQSLKAVCAKCHNLQIVMDTPKSYDAWHDTVQKMVNLGAKGTDEQYDDIMDYLHRTITTIDVNSADPDELEIVLNDVRTESRCQIPAGDRYCGSQFGSVSRRYFYCLVSTLWQYLDSLSHREPGLPFRNGHFHKHRAPDP